MNKPVSASDLVTPKVTTGPICGSRKIYTTPEAAADLRVPFREIALDPSAKEPPVRVYDSSGIYTDDNLGVDVEQGLKRIRAEWVRERGGIEEYQGRPVKHRTRDREFLFHAPAPLAHRILAPVP